MERQAEGPIRDHPLGVPRRAFIAEILDDRLARSPIDSACTDHYRCNGVLPAFGFLTT